MLLMTMEKMMPRQKNGKIDNLNYRYIGDKNENFVKNICNHGLEEKEVHLTGIVNGKMGLKKLSMDI